jgi:mycothiol system anti-sigma-R factor
VICSPVRATLFQYLDGELPPEPRRLLEAHVGSCPDCQHALELERAFREIYVAPLRPDPAPESVRDRVARHLAELSGTSPTVWQRPLRRRTLATAALATLCLAAGIAALLTTWTRREAAASLVRLADASVEQHQKLARGVLPYDIVPGSARQAEEWFANKLDFNVRLPDLKGEHLRILGGRISHLREFEVAALEYRVDQKNVTLFIMPADQYQKLGLTAEPKFKMVNRQGYDVIVWSSHGAAYALVSEIGGRSCTVCHSPEERLDVTLKPEVHRPR